MASCRGPLLKTSWGCRWDNGESVKGFREQSKVLSATIKANPQLVPTPSQAALEPLMSPLL